MDEERKQAIERLLEIAVMLEQGGHENTVNAYGYLIGVTHTMRSLAEDALADDEEETLRKQADAVAKLSLAEQHNWLCHGDGSECEDGCNAAPLPNRLRAYQDWCDRQG